MFQKELDEFILAPLRGVTTRSFRNLLAHWFTVPQRAVAPFIPTVAGERVKAELLKDIDPAGGQALTVIPQVIGKDAAQLRVMLRAFKELGYGCADLNAGCPYPFIIKKGRGAGLLRDATALAKMLEVGCAEMSGGFSLKVRLGIEEFSLLLKRMELINSFPLCEVTIHARSARQMYTGSVALKEFVTAASACKHSVVYNGDIFTLADFHKLKERMPQIKRWMVGRGAARDPFLFGDLLVRAPQERDGARLEHFLADYLEVSLEELHGSASVLGRMKELWSYLHLSLPQGAALWCEVRVCRTVDEYRRVVEGIDF